MIAAVRVFFRFCRPNATFVGRFRASSLTREQFLSFSLQVRQIVFGGQQSPAQPGELDNQGSVVALSLGGVTRGVC